MQRDQNRAVIEHITPSINGGKFPIKKVVNEYVTVEADVFADGNDVIQCALKYKHSKARKWREVRMVQLENDRWSSDFVVNKQGYYAYGIEAWVDYALNWQHGISRKIADGQRVVSELKDGIQYLLPIQKEVKGVEKEFIKKAIKAFEDEALYPKALELAQSKKLQKLLIQYPAKFFLVSSETLQVYVDREKAGFSTWYQFFPRSTGDQGTHGSFKTCEKILPRISDMGFDVLYFPPIHPIGNKNRKGKNNSTTAQTLDVGSPWAVGSKHGGHKTVNPALGSLSDFKSLIKSAKANNIEIAMDLAFQAAPDHPYITTNPEWFRWRPDGTVQYSKNPTKEHQDILPIHFETSAWKNLWDELLDICLYWIKQGVTIFRMDTPHEKPFQFWGWLINQVKLKHPDILFLSDVTSRSKVMNKLAKQGFSQSSTHFTKKNSKEELTQHLDDLTKSEQQYFLRPSFWPNTPNINPWSLQSGHENVYVVRHFLAATLSANYGIYGPVFELMEGSAIPGKQEYLNSEKYEIRNWDWKKENKLTHLITRVNQVRKKNKALQQTNNIQFCSIDNEHLIAYYKWDQEKKNHLLMVVNLDPYYRQKGLIHLPTEKLNDIEGASITAHDLITGDSYSWKKGIGLVDIHPELPYHLFELIIE